jgi:hypothetical protein
LGIYYLNGESEMPRGPLGFPRLTSIGPLVTDGGKELTLDTAGMVVDADKIGAFENGDLVEVVRLPREGNPAMEDTVDIQKFGEAGRATVDVDDFWEVVEVM